MTTKQSENNKMANSIVSKMFVDFAVINQIRERVDLHESGLIEDIINNNPDIELFNRLDIYDSPQKNAEIKQFLQHVKPAPYGYKEVPAGEFKVRQMIDKLRQTKRALNSGIQVTDEQVEKMSELHDEMLVYGKRLAAREVNYVEGNYEKGMVNPDKIQSEIDAGKNAFQKTTAFIDKFAFNPDTNELRQITQKRYVGIQNTHANYADVSSDPSFSIPYGNPKQSDTILVVAGDLHNNKVGTADNEFKSAYTMDDMEAAVFAQAMDVKGFEINSNKLAVVVVDARDYSKTLDFLEQMNPQANFMTYTDVQTDTISVRNKYGEKEVVKPVLHQVLERTAGYQISRESGLSNRPIVKQSDASLAKIIKTSNDTIDSLENKSPVEKEIIKEKVVSKILDNMVLKGREMSDKLYLSFEGADAKYATNSYSHQSRNAASTIEGLKTKAETLNKLDVSSNVESNQMSFSP